MKTSNKLKQFEKAMHDFEVLVFIDLIVIPIAVYALFIGAVFVFSNL